MAIQQFDMGRAMRGRRKRQHLDNQTRVLIEETEREIAECASRGDKFCIEARQSLIDRLLGQRPD